MSLGGAGRKTETSFTPGRLAKDFNLREAGLYEI